MANDLLAYVAVVAVCGAIFAPLHVIAVRLRRGSRLLMTINAAIVVSAIIGAAACWLWLDRMFSSPAVRDVACVGAALTFVGYAALYNLLGPAGVDRSISAHLINLIYLSPLHRIEKADLLKLYPHSDVMEKRFSECTDTGYIERTGDELRLTAKGRRIAILYLVLGKILGLRTWYLDRC